MVRFRTELLGTDGAKATLEELGRRLGDLTPVWREVVSDWKAQEKRVFETEGAAIGVRWPPLSPRYAAWKAKHFGGTMLVRSGHLRAAAVGTGSGYEEKIAQLAVEFKITDPTAQYVATRRPITRFSDIEKARWFRLLQTYVDAAVTAVGRR